MHKLPGQVRLVVRTNTGHWNWCEEVVLSWMIEIVLSLPPATLHSPLATPHKCKHPFVLSLHCIVDSLGCSDPLWMYEPILVHTDLLPGVCLTLSLMFFRLRSVTQRILVSESSGSIKETPPPLLSSLPSSSPQSFSPCPLRSASLTSLRKLLAQLFVI